MTKNDVRAAYIRLPEGLHLQLRVRAAEEDVSLNKCIIQLLQAALAEPREAAPTLPRNQ